MPTIINGYFFNLKIYYIKYSTILLCIKENLKYTSWKILKNSISTFEKIM